MDNKDFNLNLETQDRRKSTELEERHRRNNLRFD